MTDFCLFCNGWVSVLKYYGPQYQKLLTSQWKYQVNNFYHEMYYWFDQLILTLMICPKSELFIKQNIIFS